MNRSVASPAHKRSRPGKAAGGGQQAARQIAPQLGPSNQAVNTRKQPPVDWDRRVERATSAVSHGGEPLAPDVRAYFEPRFGHDFSGVRVHHDTAASANADAIDANAYTRGEHIAFGPGKYSTNTDGGRRLLAHELAHVVQQSRGGGDPAGLSPALEQGARQAATAATAGGGPVSVSGASGLGIMREENADKKSLFAEYKARADRVYQKTLEILPDSAKEKLEAANELAKKGLEAAGFSESQRDQLVGEVAARTEPLLAAAEVHLGIAPAKTTKKPAAAQPPEKSDADREKELREGVARAAKTGAIYQDPSLDRPDAEARVREKREELKTLAPDIAALLDQDPAYARARGVYGEDPNESQAIHVPAAEPGASSPAAINVEGKNIRLDGPEYTQSPRGRTSADIRDRIVRTRHVLEGLEGERASVVGSSVVIRKSIEGMVGIDPPKASDLTDIRDLLNRADAALDQDSVETAAQNYTDAAQKLRRAQWYWSRYKEFIEIGGERAIDHLEGVKEASKYSLMVLSMGGGTAVIAGTLAIFAIDATDNVAKASLGEPVDWKRFALEQAVQIVLARFGGRFSKGVVGKLLATSKFSGFKNTLTAELVVGVVNGMEARILTTAVQSKYEGKTWGQLLDDLIASASNPTGIVADLLLTAVHARLRAKPPQSAEPSGSGKPAQQAASEAQPQGKTQAQTEAKSPTQPAAQAQGQTEAQPPQQQSANTAANPDKTTAAPAPSQEPPASSGLELDPTRTSLGDGQAQPLHERDLSASGAASTSATTIGKTPTELVWLNTKTHVYHYGDSRYFGLTKEGQLMPESEALKDPRNRPAEPRTKREVSTYTRVSQEAGRIQEKVVSDITGWPKNNKTHDTKFGPRIPDYLPAKDPATDKWITASRAEDAMFVADSKYYDEKTIRLSDQIKGFIELAQKTKPPSGSKFLILFTNQSATISPEVTSWASARGVTVRQIKQMRSR